MEELLGTQWNRTAMFIKRARKQPWGSCPSTTWQNTKYFTKRDLTAGRSRCPQSEPVRECREIKAGRKLDFPRSQKGRGEINILNQQIAVLLCFNNLMGKKDPALTEPTPPTEGRLSVAEQEN